MSPLRKLMLALGAGCLSLNMARAENEQATMSPIVTQSDVAMPNTQTQQPVEAFPDWMEDLASRIQLHGYVQGGFTYNHAGGIDTNTFEIKRAYLLANAQITDRWSFLFMHDFSSVVQEYYTDYRLTNTKALTIRLGQFKNGLTYENLLPPTLLEAIDVSADGVAYLSGCGSDPLLGVQYGRDLGLSLFGETGNGTLCYRLDVMNGQGINRKDLNPEKDFIARLEWRPIRELSLLTTGQLGRGHAVNTSLYNPDIAIGQNYRRNRWTVGFAYKSSSLNLHGEYLEGKDGNVASRGAYLTGNVPIVQGKFDIVGSYDFFNFNTTLHMHQHKAIAGFQYWFYKQCRFQVQYVYKNAFVQDGVFRHGANHAVMCQMQVRFH